MAIPLASRPRAAERAGWRASRQRQTRLVKGFAYVICTVIGFMYVFPFYWMVITALKTDQQIFQWPPDLIPPTPQWQNIWEATRYIPFWLYMKNTFVICLIAVIGTLTSCTLIAYGFARIRWPGRDLAFIIYLSTMMLPGQVTMIPLYIVFRRLGWVGTIAPLVVPTFFGSAFYVFLLRQFFMTIPLELTDAARIDGANELDILWRIMLPLIKPALAAVALFTFLGNYRDFLAPLIYLTEQTQWTISLGLQLFKNMYGFQWQLMMAASALTMVPTVVLFFLTQRTFIEGITMTGIKS
jgi:multiple sugar transport system permease protein